MEMQNMSDPYNISKSFAKADGAYNANKTKHIHEKYHQAAAAHGNNTNGFNMYVKENTDWAEAAKVWQQDKGIHLNHEK
jgi:hypothetical protein